MPPIPIRTARRAAPCVFVVAIASLARCLPLDAAEPGAAATMPEPARIEFFEKRIRPLLIARCHECHGVRQPKGGLRLDSRSGVLEGGDSGPAVVPFEPDESLLVDAIRYGQVFQMPPKGKLPDAEIEALVEWVRQGAP